MSSANSRIAPAAGELTIEHVTNTLGQIETWLRAVRVALGGLAPGMSLPPVDELLLPASALRVKKECPPPRPKKPPKKKKK